MQMSETNEPKCTPMEHEYEKSVNLSIQWIRWLLKPMGVWPHSHNTSREEKFFNWLLNALCYSLLSFLFIPCGLYVILEVKDVYNKIKFCGPLSFCMMAYLKYYSISFHENDIRECIEWIKWDWRNVKHFEDKNIMVANANFGRRLVKVCIFFVYSSYVFFFIGVPATVRASARNDENITFIQTAFPFSRLIIDPRQSPTNEILFSIQLVAGVLLHGMAAAGSGLIAVFAAHVCGQMEVLICWLRHFVDGRTDMCRTIDGRTMSIVSRHVRILKCLTLIEKTVTQISLVEFAGSTFGICLLGYYIITEWNSKNITAFATYIIILVSYVFNIFIFCYIGELVATLCEKVGDMSYMIEWHRLPGSKRRCLVLIIAMSNSTMKLTAGNLIKLTFSSFTDVVNTSVAFLNVLRTLT